MCSSDLTIGKALAALDVSHADSETAHIGVAADMVARCKYLLTELEEFQDFLKEKKKDTIVDVKGFKNDVESELNRIRKVSGLLFFTCIEYFSPFTRLNYGFLSIIFSIAKMRPVSDLNESLSKIVRSISSTSLNAALQNSTMLII